MYNIGDVLIFKPTSNDPFNDNFEVGYKYIVSSSGEMTGGYYFNNDYTHYITFENSKYGGFLYYIKENFITIKEHRRYILGCILNYKK